MVTVSMMAVAYDSDTTVAATADLSVQIPFPSAQQCVSQQNNCRDQKRSEIIKVCEVDFYFETPLLFLGPKFWI